MSQAPVLGRPTTISDDVWETAAKSLGPDKSLERIEAHAKYLFSTVTIFGTLLTGFGVVSVNRNIVENPRLLYVPLALVAVSLGLSMYAMTPSAGRVNINNLVDVREYMARRVLTRGIAIFVAGLLFAAAMLSIVPLFVRTNERAVTAAMTLETTRGEKADEISASIKVHNVPADTIVEVQAAVHQDGKDVPVYWQRSTRSGGGEVAAEFKVPAGAHVRQVKASVVATRGGKVIATDSLTLRVEPRATP